MYDREIILESDGEKLEGEIYDNSITVSVSATYGRELQLTVEQVEALYHWTQIQKIKGKIR